MDVGQHGLDTEPGKVPPHLMPPPSQPPTEEEASGKRGRKKKDSTIVPKIPKRTTSKRRKSESNKDGQTTDTETDREDDDDGGAFNEILSRLDKMEASLAHKETLIKGLEAMLKKERDAASKKLAEMEATVAQLSKRIVKLEADEASIPASSLAVSDSKNVWLSRAEKLDMRKRDEKIPQPSALEMRVTSSVLSEQREREKRRNNLIVFGLKEVAAGTEEEKLRKEKEAIDDLMKAVKADPNQLTFRRFKKTSEKHTPPVLLQFKSTNARDEVLRNAKMLRGNATYERVYINADKTDNDRAEDKDIRERARSRAAKQHRMDPTTTHAPSSSTSV